MADYTVIFDANTSDLTQNVGLPMKCVHVELSHEYDRKIVPDFEAKTDEIWKAKVQQNPNLYNASKFRLHDMQDMQETRENLTLKFGLTCYKDFQCTNMQPSFVPMLEEYASTNYKEFGQYACMANAMFNSVLVESSDNCLVLFKRSDLVGESPGVLDLPGGHMEPNEVDKDELLENMVGKDVAYELYYSAVREVRDEINVPELSLSWPLLLGIIRNNTIGGKPGACFYTKCSYSNEEIKTCYNKGGPEAFESTELFFIPLKDVFEGETAEFKKLKENMAVSAQAVLNLYQPYYKSLTY